MESSAPAFASAVISIITNALSTYEVPSAVRHSGTGGQTVAPLLKTHRRLMSAQRVLSNLTFLDPESVDWHLPSEAGCGGHSSVLLDGEEKFSCSSGLQAARDSTTGRGSKQLPPTAPSQLPGQVPAHTVTSATSPGRRPPRAPCHHRHLDGGLPGRLLLRSAEVGGEIFSLQS